jgi:hypothetical protein
VPAKNNLRFSGAAETAGANRGFLMILCTWTALRSRERVASGVAAGAARLSKKEEFEDTPSESFTPVFFFVLLFQATGRCAEPLLQRPVLVDGFRDFREIF